MHRIILVAILTLVVPLAVAQQEGAASVKEVNEMYLAMFGTGLGHGEHCQLPAALIAEARKHMLETYVQLARGLHVDLKIEDLQHKAEEGRQAFLDAAKTTGQQSSPEMCQEVRKILEKDAGR